jgi:ectoine hydroxylase-related dioxygenase (phytanoyl-CoA dioxygenase family)
VMFHPSMLHGGGATGTSAPRRTLSLRFFGDDVVYEPRPRPAPRYPGTSACVSEGEPLRGPWFPQVFPR